jgi:hypothetical protein
LEVMAELAATRELALEGMREWEVWCVEKENAENESWRELAFDVIQELPSFRASTSAVSKETLGLSNSARAGGQGSRMSLRVDRFLRMITKVPIRQAKATLLNMASIVEYPSRPQKKLSTPVTARIPAIAVEVPATRSVGTQSIQ